MCTYRFGLTFEYIYDFVSWLQMLSEAMQQGSAMILEGKSSLEIKDNRVYFITVVWINMDLYMLFDA